MTAGAMTPLPSCEECTSALSAYLSLDATNNTNSCDPSSSSIETWRKLIQQCLSHGTSYDRFQDLKCQPASSASSKEEGKKNKNKHKKQDKEKSLTESTLTSRAEEAGNLLCTALEWYLTRWHRQQQQGKNDDDADIQKRLKNNPIVCAVVEALWLVGCLLESSEDETTAAAAASSAAGGNNAGDANLKRVAHECLLDIIRKLTAPRPWMTNAGIAAGDGSRTEGGAMEVDGATNGGEADGATPNPLQPLVPIASLQTALELSLLEAANLLPHPPPSSAKPKKAAVGKGGKPGPGPDTPVSAVTKKLKKTNTDMYYRQHKFNLLAEESEGYAKLWSFLVAGLSRGKEDGEGKGDDDAGRSEEARQHVRELVGAFDLDPNRALDLALDALEWELNELVSRSTKEAALGSAKSSFSELSKLAADEGSGSSWWGLEQLRTAMTGANDAGAAGAIRSLLTIVRELDGNYEDGTYGGRAVSHLLGFKYRSYRARIGGGAAAGQGKQAQPTGGGNEGKAAAAPAAGNATSNAAPAAATATTHGDSTYPRSLYLSTAFLCAHDILDPHALLPHLIANNNNSAAAAAASKPVAGGGNDTATSLMQVYRTGCADNIKRLKKLGVVSLNSSTVKKKDDDNKNSTAAAAASAIGEASSNNDPVVGIFRALLALTGDWDGSVAFLANAACGSDFTSLVQQSDEDNGAMEKLRSVMDLAALAACTVCDGVASDACAHVGSAIDDIYAECCTSSSNNTGNNNATKGQQKRRNQNANRSSMLLPLPAEGGATATFAGLVLTKDSSLAEMSSVLKAPLSSLVKSGRISRNQNLYIKLCRLYKSKMQPLPVTTATAPPASPNDESTTTAEEGTDHPSSAVAIDGDTLAVLSTFLVPSLSLFPSDTALPAELWSVLQNLPYAVRYRLYSAWRRPGLEKGTLRSLPAAAVRSGDFPKPLGIVESEIETGIAARYVLKRISKENIAERGRQLAKTSHNNPLVVFTDILGKIESYDNLILMMVDTFQYVTALGLDIMGYCLLVSLGGGGEEAGRRSRTKMAGLDTEQWLASLETFTGAFYKKFPSVELRGILAYVARRFAAGRTSELGVLRSLIKTAGGYGFVDYDSTAALSDLQLDGRRGSRLLRRETSSFGVVDDINLLSSQRLRSVLQGGDLGVVVLILLSQLRSGVLYSKPSSNAVREHVKVIGNVHDDCEAVLCLLLEYLSDSSMDAGAKEKFAASMPSLGELHGKHGVGTAVAWMLCRPLVRKSMFHADDGGPPPSYLGPFTTSEMAASYRGLLPEAAWKNVTPAMFETFYSLAVYDITCPEERYNVDIDRLKRECDRLTQLQTGGAAARGQMSVLAAAAAAAGGNYDQIRQATAFTKAHALELDRLKRNVDQLSRDFRRQQARQKLVLKRLEGRKGSLIVGFEKDEGGEEKRTTPKGNGKNSPEFAQAFMTFCVYPRCFLSPEDALYCAHFVKFLHRIQVPGFLTIELIDNIVNAVTGSLYCMTEDEAGNCSIFLNEIWKSVNSWRYDNDAFALELKDTPGAQLSKEFAQENGVENYSLTSGITHEDYKAIYNQWHQKIGSAAVGCLESSEYMHTRAALIVLSRVVLVFPTQPVTGDKILDALGPLQGDNNSNRPDIRATAQGYSSQLLKARDEGTWKEENAAATRARREREKTRAEERKRRLAKRHEDMKKESEMISRQIGDGRGSGWRPDGRRDNGGRQPWGVDPRMHSRGPPPPPNAGAPTFTAKSGESRELHGRPAGDSRGRPGMDRGDGWERDRGGGGGFDSRGRQGGSGADPSSRGEERRKRSRSPEPGEDTEQQGQRQTQKRTRGSDRDWSAPHRRGDPSSSGDPQSGSRGGVRRTDRRGGGSSRY